jgi:hypothetical protein
MFVGKARSLPYSLAPKMCFTQVGSGLTRKHETRPGIFFVNYVRKKSFRLTPGRPWEALGVPGSP